MPEHVNSASWISGGDERGRLRVGSASHGKIVGTLDRAGVVDLTDWGVWDRVSPSDRTLVGLAINDNLADDTVGLGEWEKHEGDKEEGRKEKSCGLHCLLNKSGSISLRENAFTASGLK